MFHTFSGSSKKPRQVNLSGRNPNPFLNSSNAGGTQNAVVSAQQDRIARQRERERAQAAALVQRRWRGNVVRRSVKEEQRRHWDEKEEIREVEDMEVDDEVDVPPYRSESDCQSQLWLLIRFGDFASSEDFARLSRFYKRLRKTIDGKEVDCTEGAWSLALTRLAQSCMDALQRIGDLGKDQRSECLSVVRFVIDRVPENMANLSRAYYRTLNLLLNVVPVTTDDMVAPLKAISSTTLRVYESFALEFLTRKGLHTMAGGDQQFQRLASEINCKLLGNAVASFIRTHSFNELPRIPGRRYETSWLELLGNVIYFYRHAHGFARQSRYAADEDFIYVVSSLLTYLADELDIDGPLLDRDQDPELGDNTQPSKQIDEFVKDQINSLVNQESISSLLIHVDTRSNGNRNSHDQQEVDATERIRILANYILTLIRLVPSRTGDEIRMWLFLGLSSSKGENHDGERLPVIQYFWQAAKSTRVYESISDDPRAAINLLKPRTNVHSDEAQLGIDNQWRVILLFIELYMFVLKVMDDEEFFQGGRPNKFAVTTNTLGQQNTLLLTEIEKLTTFLKHLGFTMYYNAADIIDSQEAKEEVNLGSLFRPDQLNSSDQAPEQTARRQPRNYIAGVRGMSADYVKGLVTGLLRAIYERDSRRPFLPKDHLLMTSRFDMTSFIDAVVEEEERRHKVQEEDAEDGQDSDVEEQDLNLSPRLVGTARAQRLARMERLQRQQRKASRKRYLQAVAPRLEILQNMPFLIPFKTRVQIFRRFVHMNQLKRRDGIVDPEMWRLSQQHGTGPFSRGLERHHAKIKRGNEFEDAFEQFYNLGAGLKEPIQITFVDQFDTVEAGIDGGGVTKEFLTSVTDQAFADTGEIKMFVENDQNLLYPNPSAIDEQKQVLRDAGLREHSAEFRAQVSGMLQRYEFLGRIIGKCLYEGILIDINFAGFFLLKWALTGGDGSAPRESGYRANLNDLRELDEGLYQGLLKLKNYPGDVEDFALNFTVTDTVTPPDALSHTGTRTLTRNLKPDGANTPVTNANRLVYISYIARHRLVTQPYAQTSAFLRGLASIIQPAWLSMFNQAELQTLVGGAAASISIADLRRNTVYGGVYTIGDDGREHASVRLFWEVMSELAEEEKRAVLKFVTSTPRAPLLGFGSLNPRFSIRDNGDDENRLPSTSTCVNLLKLPRFRSKGVLKRKLLQAVTSGAGFDLS